MGKLRIKTIKMVYSIKKVWKFFMTRDKLIAVAEKLFAKYGYDYTSLSQIAEETGIRKASVYAHFASKAELFLMIYQQTHDRTLAQIRETYEDDPAEMLGEDEKDIQVHLQKRVAGFLPGDDVSTKRAQERNAADLF